MANPAPIESSTRAMTPTGDITVLLEGLLRKQKAACMADPMPSLEKRLQRLDKLHNALIDNREQLAVDEVEGVDDGQHADGVITNRRPLVSVLRGVGDAPEARRAGFFAGARHRIGSRSGRP